MQFTAHVDPAIAKRDEILAEFNSKKQDYPSQWKAVYDECRAHEDFAMLGKQMDAAALTNLELPPDTKLPNLLKKYVNQQANTTLQSKFRAVVSPNGGGADIAKARQRGSVLRGIQVATAGPVYNAARRGQLAAGIHYSRVVVDYASQRGFEKSFRYEDVVDTYNTFPDPYVATPTFADMRDFLIREKVPKSLWKERTGQDWGFSSEKDRELWYYWKKRGVLTDKEYLMKDGAEKLGADLGGEEPDLSDVMMMDDGETPFARDVSVYDWEWHMIEGEGKQVIKSGDWKGCYPPLVACTGERVVEQVGSSTKIHYLPLTADAEEPQQLYTLIELVIKMRLARSPYSKWIVPFESILNNQDQDLQTASIVGKMDVLYKSWDGDKQIPAPQEREPFILDRLLIELQQVQQQKIEAILGIPAAVFGERTNEKSGLAIRERRKEGDVSSYHFTYNFLEYVKQMGLATLEAFPHYYTTVQQVGFMDKDDKAVMETINLPGGVSFDPNERYSLVVEVQPDSDTNREEEAESLLAMVDSPQLGPLIMRAKGGAALVVKAQKGRYAQELGEALEGMENDPEKQEMGARIQELEQAGRQLEDKYRALEADKEIELLKEQNRHAEKMAELAARVADNADKNEIAGYNAETNREKVNGIPQMPNSLGAPEDLV